MLPSCEGFGAAYGTAKSGAGIASVSVKRPELVMKSAVPVVMAGVLGIYGLVIATFISTGSKSPIIPVLAQQHQICSCSGIVFSAKTTICFSVVSWLCQEICCVLLCALPHGLLTFYWIH